MPETMAFTLKKDYVIVKIKTLSMRKPYREGGEERHGKDK
jgi:hypothetical protein